MVTDKTAYLKIVALANNGNRKAGKFIDKMDDFIDNGGKLFLIDGLYLNSKNTLNEIKTEIQQKAKEVGN